MNKWKKAAAIIMTMVCMLNGKVAKADSGTRLYDLQFPGTAVNFVVENVDRDRLQGAKVELYTKNDYKIAEWTSGANREAKIYSSNVKLVNKDPYFCDFKVNVPDIIGQDIIELGDISYRRVDSENKWKEYNYPGNNKKVQEMSLGCGYEYDVMFTYREQYKDEIEIPANKAYVWNRNSDAVFTSFEIRPIDDDSHNNKKYSDTSSGKWSEYTFTPGDYNFYYDGGGNRNDICKIADHPVKYHKIKVHLADFLGGIVDDDRI